MAVEQPAVDKAADFDVQVSACQCRPQIGDGGAAAAAIAYGHLPPGEAFLPTAVKVIGPAETRGRARGRGGLHDRIDKARVTRRPGPIAAQILVRPPLPTL